MVLRSAPCGAGEKAVDLHQLELSWQQRKERRCALLRGTPSPHTPQPLSRPLETPTDTHSTFSTFSTSSDGSKQEEDLANQLLEHCFQKHKFEEKHPNFFLKLKASRFGPPKSRRRNLIAPPMEGMAPSSHKPRLQPPTEPKEKARVLEELPVKAKATVGDELEILHAWMEERTKLRNLLDNCVDLEKWLERKIPTTSQEERILGKIRQCNLTPEQSKAVVSAVSSFQLLIPKQPPRKKIPPKLEMPFPDSFITLQNILNKQKLKLVDIFSRVDKSKTMKFRRKDFLKIMQETKVPISPEILEDAVIYLSLKNKNYITCDDIAECQKVWMSYWRKQREEQWKELQERKSAQSRQKKNVSKDLDKPPDGSESPPATCVVFPRPTTSDDESKSVKSPESPKVNQLQVPPINTEIDFMPLTYNEMEMVGKRLREMRRRLKRKIDPLEWLEQCQVVKTGDMAVDGHCKPSTINGEMGEIIDKFRMDTHLVYHRCVKMCKALGIPISERVLKRGLLYAGDRILKDGEHVRKIRQPGGYYDATTQESSSDEESVRSPVLRKSVIVSSLRQLPCSWTTSVPSAYLSILFWKKTVSTILTMSTQKVIFKREPKKERGVKKEEVRQLGPLRFRWKNYKEFKSMRHPKPFGFWTLKSFEDARAHPHKSTSRLSVEISDEKHERLLRKMYGFLNPLTHPNNFWPGHLLDKLHLCRPEMEGDEAEALFSHVLPEHPVYPATYSPDRSWPVNDQGYVIYGGLDSQKEYYCT